MAIVKQQKTQIIDCDERQRPRDFAGLAYSLEFYQPTARRWAALDLVDFPESSPLLVARLKQEQDDYVRNAILTSLTLLHDSVAIAGLIECLRSEDVALRNEVIETLKHLPDQIAPIMDELLHDADPDVRIFAVNILESLRHEHVEAWLIKVIEQDQHLNVCSVAVDLLSEVGTSASASALQQLKARFVNEPYICFAADLALQRILRD